MLQTVALSLEYLFEAAGQLAEPRATIFLFQILWKILRGH